ncbi:ABC transporter permease [Actinomadura soli]|uniref:ABC transporter permease n=1 Tax=Actinomadura soli TaxID=2508997 RepID=A0A5C4JJ34_9ACTN|nr:ABC transporter permease [Actinomadura soli]TMR06936.1 ABC transporter permease [Actinomadura soli]
MKAITEHGAGDRPTATVLQPGDEFARELGGGASPARRHFASAVPSASGCVVLAVVLFTQLAPFLAPHPVREVIGAPYAGPGEAGVLGTDYLGRDLLSRLLAGGRSLMLLAAACTIAAGVLGTALGLLLGYIRGVAAAVLNRVVDLFLILPPLVVLLVLTSGSARGTTILIPTIMISAAPYIARIVRTATLGVVRSPFVEAAVLRGESRRAILLREILPNIAGPVLAITGLLLIYSIFVIASAGFLGVGTQPPAADWALMIKENMPGVTLSPWPVAFPALAIIALAVSVNIFSDGLHRRIAGGRAGRDGA